MVILAFGLMAFWQSLNCQFLSDDYYLVTLAESKHYSPALFVHGGGTEFFRPLGGLALAATAWIAGTSTLLWHFASLSIHLANSVVVFFLARRLHFGRTSARIAAILFTIHGTRPEAVTWIAGRFDLIATLFVLAGLYLFVAHYQTEHVAYKWGALIAMGLAILTKESAYSFPLLAAAVLAVLPGASFRQLRRTLPYWALAALLFAVRWWALGGIGGYVDRQTGKPEILQLGVLSAVKALALRIWSVVYFPINWSEEPSRLLALLIAATVAIVVWLLWNISLNGRQLWFSVGFVLVSSLPALPQLLIGNDLQKSRLLYLPTLGFCLLFGLALEQVRPTAVLALMVGVFLFFHVVCLHHDLDIWSRVGMLANRACSRIASNVSPSTRLVIVSRLPGSIDGVYFLRNGLYSCLSLKSGHSLDVDIRESGSAGPGVALFEWDESDQSIKER